MRILSANNEESLRAAINVLRTGGIVAHPTETCYGFACDLTNPDAVQKLFVLKQRPEDQLVSALFANVSEAKKYVEWNEKAEELAQKYVPGPLTIVLPLRRNDITLYRNTVPSSSVIMGAGLGIRVSSHPVAQELAELCKVPLSTTSANLHGQPEPYSVSEILGQFSAQALQPDLILDGGVLPHAPPSTVVKMAGTTIIIVRQGGVLVE